MDTKNGPGTERAEEFGQGYNSMISISPTQILKVIHKRIPLIIAVAFVFALIGAIRAIPFGQNKYEVSASVIYHEEETSVEYLPSGVSPLAEQIRRTKAYAKLFKEHNVLDAVIDGLAEKGIEVEYDEIEKKLRVWAGSDTPVIYFKITGDDEEELLLTIALLLEHKDEVMFGDHTAGEAKIMNEPMSEEIEFDFVSIIKNAFAYAVLGAALAIAIIIAGEIYRIVTSRAIQSEKELADAMKCPVLAVVPICGEAKENPTKDKNDQDTEMALISAGSKPQYIQAFMMLRTNLINIIERQEDIGKQGGDGKVIMVTSCIPGEGKSNTGVNLASVLSTSVCKVLLVDASFTNRTLSKVFLAGVEHRGILELLNEDAKASEAIMHLQDRQFDFMPAGREKDTISVFDDRKMKELFDELRAMYEVIIVDTESVNTSAVPSAIGKLCDGCIAVVAHASTSRSNVTACRDQLINSSTPVLGAVLNLYDSMKDSAASITKYYSE